MYDLLIKDGLVVDPFQGLYGKRDIAVSDGRIEAVEPCISSTNVKKVIDAKVQHFIILCENPLNIIHRLNPSNTLF
jgi:dihydroorotase-like cyclic amidohydrolase